jgi:hypothetical protein
VVVHYLGCKAIQEIGFLRNFWGLQQKLNAFVTEAIRKGTTAIKVFFLFNFSLKKIKQKIKIIKS